MALPVASSSGRKLFVTAHGSRGDCQPLIALSLGLQKAGFVVRLSINVNHVEFARSLGLDAVDGSWDCERHVREEGPLKDLMTKGDNMGYAAAVQKINKAEFPSCLARKIEAFRSFAPDVLITTPLNFFEDFVLGFSAGIPVVWANLQLNFPTREQTSFLAEPKWAPHRMIQHLFLFSWWKGECDSKAEAIMEQLPEGKPLVLTTFQQYMFAIQHPIAPSLGGVSPSLKSIPSDYTEDLKKQVLLTGFWTLTCEEQHARLQVGDKMFGGEEKDALEAFMAQGSPPAYIGWGSMCAVSSQHMTLLAVRALMKAELRGVVLRGNAELDPRHLQGQPDSECLAAYAATHILFVKTAPHEWLFPKCSVTVHHGGAGTYGAALRSGVPTVVTPCAFDQFEHADIVARQGAGVSMKHVSKVTAADLAAAMKRCISDKGMQERCRAIRGTLQGEDGIGNAVRRVDGFITDEVETGKWKARFISRTRELKFLKSKRPPGCLAWMGRLCCSPSANDYSVKVAGKEPLLAPDTVKA